MDNHELICDIMQILINLKRTAEYEQKLSKDYINGINASLEEIRNYRKQGKWME